MNSTHGYDNIKPFVVCLQGCIDGYSRKVMCQVTAFV